ncbi:hypothetical protein C491_16462 [Natronococcus amylolyticus DSM 10524]|uniref:SpoVT-AbrB domain-containing protein n=1 Tax=Natronococcus amylolyticus DSM 10524 TaxID=1227497 RepID=L9X1H8_9EURY|nr:AbrB/MazE/SpoVT family DNA-binding domain-containing protein [Natronococcus amylolyticus]ELY55326.1 hypothetical protein C491_16462 [Natronococcus amylolyticus DSM 10524]
MPEATVDDLGRLTLPEEVRERYGERYYIVQLPDRVTLVPIADDPLETLKDEFADVDGSARDLRDAARKRALNEVDD